MITKAQLQERIAREMSVAESVDLDFGVPFPMFAAVPMSGVRNIEMAKRYFLAELEQIQPQEQEKIERFEKKLEIILAAIIRRHYTPVLKEQLLALLGEERFVTLSKQLSAEFGFDLTKYEVALSRCDEHLVKLINGAEKKRNRLKKNLEALNQSSHINSNVELQDKLAALITAVDATQNQSCFALYDVMMTAYQFVAKCIWLHLASEFPTKIDLSYLQDVMSFLPGLVNMDLFGDFYAAQPESFATIFDNVFALRDEPFAIEANNAAGKANVIVQADLREAVFAMLEKRPDLEPQFIELTEIGLSSDRLRAIHAQVFSSGAKSKKHRPPPLLLPSHPDQVDWSDFILGLDDALPPGCVQTERESSDEQWSSSRYGTFAVHPNEEERKQRSYSPPTPG